MSSFPPGGTPPQPPSGAGWPPPASPPPPYPAQSPGWYSGPFPPPGLNPRGDGLWFSLLRAGLKTLVVTFALGLGLIATVLVFGACAAAISSAGDSNPDDLETSFVYGDRGSDTRLLSIRIDGVILGEDPGRSLFDLSPAATYGYTVKDDLRKAARDSSIAGVVLELSTPGGTIFGAQAIADGIRDYQQQTGKPVLAFVDGLSASGGMYAMAPATRILADNGSLVGSIGVIIGPFVYYDGPVATEGGILGGGVTTRNGITSEYITAGRGKDVGNPYRKLTDEERATFQRSIDSLYAQFVKHVSTYRKITEAQIRDQLGAMIYGNSDAQQFGLIDGTASREQAYSTLASLANLGEDDWKVVRLKRGTSFADIFSKADAPQGAALQAAQQARAAELCFAPNSALVYYGDPAALCSR